MTMTDVKSAPDSQRKPRQIRVVVDNDSWILPYAEQLVQERNDAGDSAVLCRAHGEITENDVTFYLGCIKIAPPDVLSRARRNLVVHEGDLPRDKGFSPLTWQILEGKNAVPICLFEATEEADAGPVVYHEVMHFEGTELVDELRAAQGEYSLRLCREFLDAAAAPAGQPQIGEASHRARRTPKDSELDPAKSIADQFDLLRVVDNDRYPAYFTHRGRRYILKVLHA